MKPLNSRLETCQVLLSIKEASSYLDLHRRTLERLRERGLIEFQRVNDRVFIPLESLLDAPILTLGKAAKLINRGWFTAKNWRDAGYLQAHYELPGSKARCSINEIIKAKQSSKRKSRSNTGQD